MEPSRRASQPAPPEHIPLPPPLPPPASASKASYFSRLVTQVSTTAYGGGSRPPSAQTNRPDGGRPNPLVPKLPGIRTGTSQDASHKTGLEIAALDINRERTHAVLAGREILKTVRVKDAKIVEDTNLRFAVLNQTRSREGLVIEDVKWSHGHFSTHIATAAANGKIILYDLNRSEELAKLHEHSRQVHKLAFNPHQGHMLLSASHDTTVRLWDLRDVKKSASTCRSRSQYAGINGGIFDVQWSPTDGVEFAFGTDNGTIQRWDYRYMKGPKQKITAHDQKAVKSIDWHPSGKHLLSASVDRTVKVWDFSVDGRRQKPDFVLTTPYSVHRARWRLAYWSNEHFEAGAWQCTQLATSYDRDHPVIHVWDFRRPHLPFREINKFATAPSDMLWGSRDTLWTVGREGVFQQTDVHHAPKVVDRRNLQAFAVSPSGEIGGFAQKRPRRRRSAGTTYSEDTYSNDPPDKRSSPEKGSLRSSADDSLDDGFLKRHHGRTASNRSAKSFSTTPPASDTAPKVMFLTDSMAIADESSKPNQLAFRGALPGAINVQILAYLAQKYKAIPLPDPPTMQSYLDLQHVFEQNAQYAQRAALYRLADTWRIVGVSIAVATRRRAEMHRNQRLLKHKPMEPASAIQPKVLSERAEAYDKRAAAPHPAVRALLGAHDKQPSAGQTTGQPLATVESTSNLPTPLARPLPDAASGAADRDKSHLPDPDHDEEIKLPPAVAGPHSKSSLLTPDSAIRPHAEGPSFNGPQWYHSSDDLDERRAMVGSWRAPPRVPLSLEPTEAQGINIRIPPRLDRHDSDESFAMFSASTDSQRGNSMPSSLASGKSHSQGMESIPELWHHAPGESSFGQPRHTMRDASDRHGDVLAKSVHISPTTIPIGMHKDGPVARSGQGGQSGSARDETAHPAEYSSRDKAVQDIENLRRNNQLLRHDSSESEAYTSSTGGVSSSSLADYSHDMEASGTIVPEGYEDFKSPPALKPPATLPHVTESAPPALDPAAEDPLVLSDFQDMHVDAEEGSAFAVIGLLKNILAFHTSTMCDAQSASLLLLLLAPLLPQTRNLSETSGIDAAEVLSAFADTFTALGLSPTQARAILSTQLTELIATGINPYEAEAILLSYHAQLHSLSLYNSAATLRRLAYPTYPAVYEQALKDTQLGLLCLSCKSPINNPKDKMRCESCKRAQAPCPICWGRYPAFEPVAAKKKAKAKLRSTLKDRDHRRKRSSLMSNIAIEVDEPDETPSASVPEKPTAPKPTLWTWCPLCGHGGHTHCLSTWFAETSLSDGACATEGCLCDCVQGKRRDDKIAEILRKKAEKDRAKVVRKGDDWRVGESKAVSAVRGAIGDAANAGPSPSGLLPGRTKDDGRRVRLVEPRDETHPPPSQFGIQQGPPFGKMPKH